MPPLYTPKNLYNKKILLLSYYNLYLSILAFKNGVAF